VRTHDKHQEDVRSPPEREPRLLDPVYIAVAPTGTVGERGAAVEHAEPIEGVDQAVDSPDVRSLRDDVRDDEPRCVVMRMPAWEAELPAQSIEASRMAGSRSGARSGIGARATRSRMWRD